MASRRAAQWLALRGGRGASTAPRTVGVASRIGGLEKTARCWGGVGTRGAGYPSGVRCAAVAGGRATVRWHSSFPSERKSKIWEFDDILSLLSNPSTSPASPLLIDVREPHEYTANSIPTALNLPITSQPDALLLSAEDFEDRFGFAKPPLEREVVFFCKAGVRSRAAAQIAAMAGYRSIGEYPGSWRDWESKGGPGTRTPPQAGGKGEPVGREVKETDGTGNAARTKGDEGVL